jgi:hypothetical protein
MAIVNSKLLVTSLPEGMAFFSQNTVSTLKASYGNSTGRCLMLVLHLTSGFLTLIYLWDIEIYHWNGYEWI